MGWEIYLGLTLCKPGTGQMVYNRGEMAKRTGNKPGAPSKLTDELIEQLGAVSATGANQQSCAYHVGVTPTTLSKWLEQGRTDLASERDSLCAKLVLTMHTRREQSIITVLDNLRTNPDWKAQLEWLKRVSKDYVSADILKEKEVQDLGAVLSNLKTIYEGRAQNG